jgi:hypothetical protein
VAGVAALGLAAVQVVPFIEYLLNSQMLAVRSGAHGFGSLPFHLPTHVFPALLGNPSTTYNPVITYNFQEAASIYLGVIVLFLAGVGAATLPLHRSPRALFFTCAASFWLIYVYDIGGLGKWIHAVPPFGLGATTRTHVIWAFSVSCLAAIGFHVLAVGTLRPPRLLPARARSLPLD